MYVVLWFRTTLRYHEKLECAIRMSGKAPTRDVLLGLLQSSENSSLRARAQVATAETHAILRTCNAIKADSQMQRLGARNDTLQLYSPAQILLHVRKE